MARSRRSRVTSDNARRSLRFSSPLASLSPVPYSTLTLPSSRLRLYEDRRQWHPEGRYAPARSFSQTRHRLRVGSQRSARPSGRFGSVQSLWRGLPSSVAFSRPSKVLVCVRRRMRREVLHAYGRAGRRGQRPQRRSYYSSISCRG